MPSALDTKPSLLLRLRDPDDAEAWSRFVELYAPAVFAYLLKRGLQHADAADLTQDVMFTAATALKSFRYDSRRGSFRKWLFTVVQNRLRDHWRKAKHGLGAGDTNVQQMLLEQPSADSSLPLQWDCEYERRLFQYAAKQVQGDFQETTWQAFWETAVAGRAGEQVAREIGISVAAVYAAKGRVIKRIQQQIRILEE